MARTTPRSPARSALAPALTHVDGDGRVVMVNVGAKAASTRVAIAEARVCCAPSTRDALLSTSTSKKGEAIVTAKLAGILAAKQTDRLIPLCHGLALEDVAVDVDAVADGFVVRARAQTTGKTGVEMEAMVAASIAALTLYDMGKAMERGMRVTEVRLVEKSGGKSGTWRAPSTTPTTTTASATPATTTSTASKTQNAKTAKVHGTRNNTPSAKKGPMTTTPSTKSPSTQSATASTKSPSTKTASTTKSPSTQSATASTKTTKTTNQKKKT
jgi:cyclic pyranopterin phosphate synthase